MAELVAQVVQALSATIAKVLVFDVLFPLSEQFAKPAAWNRDRAVGMSFELVGAQMSFVADFQNPTIDQRNAERLDQVAGQRRTSGTEVVIKTLRGFESAGSDFHFHAMGQPSVAQAQ